MSLRQLDGSQLDAVEIDPSVRQVVIAGPGSGKTEVVSALIEQMTEEHGVDPAYGLLVISFSNAAVHAAEARLKGQGAGPVGVQTMDSLAAELLRDVAVDDYGSLDFDDRVMSATRLLLSEGWDRIADLEHLVVDEVQDLVGVRADFLSAIVASLPISAGFTLLGDPAQGIYDFQLRQTSTDRNPRSTTTSSELLAAVTARDDVVVKPLTGQYRAMSRDAQAAARLRQSVLPGGDGSAIEQFVADLVDLGEIGDTLDLVESWPGSTALLTATNGQALHTAGTLRANGVLTEIRRSARQQVAAGWVAMVVGDVPTDTVSRAEFEKLVVSRCPELDVPSAWRALRSLGGARGTEVNLTRIATRLRTTRPLLPDLAEEPSARVVVSTVHRAKGLEFDNVVLLEFPDRDYRGDAAPEIDELLRSRFVALTRAREHLARAEGPDDRKVRRFSRAGIHRHRWYIGGPKSWMTFGYEVGVGDVEPILEDPTPGQHLLSTVVSPGDPLELRLDVEASTLTVPVYSVIHDGSVIARTSRVFGEDLVTRIGTLENRKGNWPRLTGAQVEGTGTFVSDPLPGTAWRHGLLLTPIVTGLLELNWNGATE